MLPVAVCSETTMLMSLGSWRSDYKGPETNSGAPKTNLSNYHSSSEDDSIDRWKHGDKTDTVKTNNDESWDSN
jgi:hypothetical protein